MSYSSRRAPGPRRNTACPVTTRSLRSPLGRPVRWSQYGRRFRCEAHRRAGRSSAAETGGPGPSRCRSCQAPTTTTTTTSGRDHGVRGGFARVEAPAATSTFCVNTPAPAGCFRPPGIKWSGAAGQELQAPNCARADVLQRDGQMAFHVVGKGKAQSITAVSSKHRVMFRGGLCSVPPATIRNADPPRASCGLTMVSTQTRLTRDQQTAPRRRRLDSARQGLSGRGFRRSTIYGGDRRNARRQLG